VSDEAQFLKAQEQRLWRLLLGASMACEFFLIFPLTLWFISDNVDFYAAPELRRAHLGNHDDKEYDILIFILLLNILASLLLSIPAKVRWRVRLLLFFPFAFDVLLRLSMASPYFPAEWFIK
jgi:hypothetical protein